jgi:hypothetical protein
MAYKRLEKKSFNSHNENLVLEKLNEELKLKI